MKLSTTKKTFVFVCISTVFIAGLSTVYAGNVYNENQEFKIENLIQSNILPKEKCRIFDFIFGLISKTIGLAVFSIGTVLAFVITLIGSSIYDSIEDMPLLKISTPIIAGIIAGRIMGKSLSFALKRLDLLGDTLVNFLALLLLAFMPLYLYSST